MTSLSLVIPLHNYARWVGTAIQSAKAQTVQPLEIIVVDDASTDNPAITQPGVTLIQLRENVGVAEARNIGIEQARGDIILCLDADDMLSPDYIRRGLPLFADRRVGIVYGPLNLMDEHGNPSGRQWFTAAFNYSKHITGYNQVPSCAMFRREAWSRAGGYRKYETPAEDAGLWMRIASHGWKVEHLEDGRPIAFYRLHSGSLSRSARFPDWYASGRAWKTRNSGVGYPVQIYDCPQVSFIMEYCAADRLDFIRTLDSIEGLTAIDWEICAVGEPSLRLLAGWPFVRWNAEPNTSTLVYLEAGEIVTDAEWSTIMERKEWPR